MIKEDPQPEQFGLERVRMESAKYSREGGGGEGQLRSVGVRGEGEAAFGEGGGVGGD